MSVFTTTTTAATTAVVTTTVTTFLLTSSHVIENISLNYITDSYYLGANFKQCVLKYLHWLLKPKKVR